MLFHVCDSVSNRFLTGSAELVAIITVSVVIVAGVLIAVVVVIVIITIIQREKQARINSANLVTTVTNINHEMPFVQTGIEKSDTSTKSL